MKRKIGEIYNKPIIEGDINLKTPNEIHKSELSSDGGSSSNKYAPRYFSIDWDKCSDSWKYILSEYNVIEETSYYRSIGFSATVKSYRDGNYIIGSFYTSDAEEIKAFSYLPLRMSDFIQEAFGVQYQMPFNINDLIEFVNKVIKDGLNLDIEPISMEGITEITEEEYYTI